MKQQIGFAGHTPRAALHQHALEAAEAGIVAELGQVVHIDVDITRDKKIHAAVAIVVSPGGASAESACAHAGLVGYILKLAVAQIVIERVAAVAGNVNILQAVVVVIGDSHAHAPALARETGGLRDVGKFKIVTLRIGILMIERDHQVTTLAIARHRRSVHGDDVEFAIVVAVDQTYAAAHGFDDVFLIGRGNMRDRQPCLLRDIFKLWERTLSVLFFGRKGRWRLRLGTSGLCKQQRGEEQSRPQGKQCSHRQETDYTARGRTVVLDRENQDRTQLCKSESVLGPSRKPYGKRVTARGAWPSFPSNTTITELQKPRRCGSGQLWSHPQ